MSDVATPTPRPARLSIAAWFAAAGPAIGTLGVIVVTLVANPASWREITGFIPVAFMLGYVFGFAPALLAGIAYGFAPPVLQRIVLSPVFGVLAVWFLNELLGASGVSNDPLMLGAGAVAALGCAILVRGMKLDGISRPERGAERDIQRSN